MLTTTIIGSGFLAKNFKNYESLFKKLNICIYSAGVSNSLCVDEQLFKKDQNRLISFNKEIDKKNILLYFSTCSIADPSRSNSPYVKNKLKIEKFIKSNFEKYLIIRLPEVVGKTKNNNTLINFFYNKINQKEKFTLWSRATRSIIDIEDVTKLMIDFLSNIKIDKKIINIANPLKYSALEIVKNIEKLVSKKAQYDLIDKGDLSWKIDISEISKSIKNCRIKFNNDYLENVLKKYFI